MPNSNKYSSNRQTSQDNFKWIVTTPSAFLASGTGIAAFLNYQHQVEKGEWERKRAEEEKAKATAQEKQQRYEEELKAWETFSPKAINISQNVKLRSLEVDHFDLERGYVFPAVEFAKSVAVPVEGKPETMSINHVLASGLGHAGIIVGK